MNAKSVIEAASGAYRCIFGESCPVSLIEGLATGRANDYLVSEAVKLHPFDHSLLGDNCIANLHDVCDKSTGMYHYTLNQPVRFIHYTDDDSRLSDIIRSGAIRCMPCRGDSTHGVWTNIFGEKLLSDFIYKSAIVFDAPAGTPIELMNNTQALFHADIPQEWFVSVNFMVGPDMSANMLGFIGEHGERWPDTRIVDLFTGEDSGRLTSFVSTGNMEKLLKLYTGRDISLGATYPMTESYTDDIGAVARRIKGGDEPTFRHDGYLLNKWLVHFTPYATEIAEHGFRYGRHPYDEMGPALDVEELERTGTSALNADSPETHGIEWNGNLVFAFPLSDIVEMEDVHSYPYDGCYGNTGDSGAVVFIGSGEYVFETGDVEEQVIVDKRTVHGAVLVSSEGTVEGNVNGRSKVLYRPRYTNPDAEPSYIDGFKWIAEHQTEAIMHMFRWDDTDIVPSALPMTNRCRPQDYIKRVERNRIIEQNISQLNSIVRTWIDAGRNINAEYKLPDPVTGGLTFKINKSVVHKDDLTDCNLSEDEHGPVIELYLRNVIRHHGTYDGKLSPYMKTLDDHLVNGGPILSDDDKNKLHQLLHCPVTTSYPDIEGCLKGAVYRFYDLYAKKHGLK